MNLLIQRGAPLLNGKNRDQQHTQHTATAHTATLSYNNTFRFKVGDKSLPSHLFFLPSLFPKRRKRGWIKGNVRMTHTKRTHTQTDAQTHLQTHHMCTPADTLQMQPYSKTHRRSPTRNNTCAWNAHERPDIYHSL